MILENKKNQPGVRIAWSSQTYEPKKNDVMYVSRDQMENGFTRYIRALVGLGNLIRFKNWNHFVKAGPKRAPMDESVSI